MPDLKVLRELPTVELVDDAFYWIKSAYTDPDRWTVAKWEHGCWWDANGKEARPRVISGPIPRPEDLLANTEGEG